MASEHSQELMWAVKNGDLDVVRQLVETHVSLVEKAYHGKKEKEKEIKEM